MRTAVFLIFNYAIFVFILSGCSSSSSQLFPPTEASLSTIATLRPQVDTLDARLNIITKRFPSLYNTTTRIRSESFNRLLDMYAEQRTNDININFLATSPLWKEDKSILGISYTNVVNIDSGSLSIDLKKFHIKWAMNNMVNVEVEIEGSGFISASGQYTGVSAKVSPNIHFYLNDFVVFTISSTDSQTILLTPQPKTLVLKAQVTLQLMQLQVPYYKEIPLQAKDIIQPLRFPAALRSEIIFPLPAATFGGQKFEFAKRTLDFTNTHVSIMNNIFEIQGNVNFEKPQQ